MVAAGLGSTLLPAMALPHLAADDQRLAVRPINAAKASRVIGLLWRSSFPRGDDLLMLGRFIQEQLPDSVAPIRQLPKAAIRDPEGDPRKVARAKPRPRA
jgi:LysR family transcriptional regulator, hydrogen peroxide-inducible genes activator